LLGSFSTDSAHAAGLVGDSAAAAADKVVAIYRACQLFSFLPYQLLFAITFILFPLLAKAHGEGDEAAVRGYVKSGIRLALLFGGAIVAVTAGLPGGVLHLAFKPEIADPAGAVLRVLALGQGAFALFGVATTVLNSTGHERTTVALNAVALGLVVGLAYVLVPGTSLDELPRRMAIAVACGLAGALVLGGIAVRYHLGALVELLPVVRIGAALAIAATVGAFLPPAGKLLTLVYAGVVGVVYLTVLLASRELGATDFALVKRVIGRKKGTA
jgi:stage V sporulation protein B